MNNYIRVGIAVTVAVIWGANYIVSIVNHSYHPPPEVNGVMLMVAGYFFATGIREQERKDTIRDMKELDEKKKGKSE